MMTCEESSRLISLQLDQPLPLLQKVRLWFHLMLCRRCGEFYSFAHNLQAAFRDIDPTELSGLPQLAECVKEKVAQQVRSGNQ